MLCSVPVCAVVWGFGIHLSTEAYFNVLGDLFYKAGLFFILMFIRKHEQKHIKL